MNESTNFNITIYCDANRNRGMFCAGRSGDNGVWDRLCQLAISISDDCKFTPASVNLPLRSALSIIRQFAPNQRKWKFCFKLDRSAEEEVSNFLEQHKKAREARVTPPQTLSDDQIKERLGALGFTKRELKSFQLRDLKKLVSLPNGANFSVPGAGKTTVTFALHLLTHIEDQHLFVVGPKSSFSVWSEIVRECIGEKAPEWVKEPFTILSGGAKAVKDALNSDATRFVINYEQLIILSDVFTNYLAQNSVHLVLDESHRMKGGLAVKRGIVLLDAATRPKRRDILSGTPMPQGPRDLQSQLDFLWPGSDLGYQITTGKTPREVIGNLYVRTTKKDLGLPLVCRRFIHVDMSEGQSALYAIVKNESLRDLSSLKSGSGVDIPRARRSVMRLLQLSVNPMLALRSIMDNAPSVKSGIAQQVMEDGPSPKMLTTRDLARELASRGRKVVIWTIFTHTILEMKHMLADLNPVLIYGEVPSGAPSDPNTREGKIQRFHNDSSCMALIANPAAAGEGINLHHACHDAIYLDRNYNTNHYLQSIDRIHRLGLPPETETNIHIIQTKAPKGLGCIDYSVSRRLAKKIENLQLLLDDEDLHQIALDEEQTPPPIDYSTSRDDLLDLIEELEGRTRFNEKEGI